MIYVSACIDYNQLLVFERKYEFRNGEPLYDVTSRRMIECKPFKLKDILKAKGFDEMMQKLGELFKGKSAFDDLLAFFKTNGIKCKVDSSGSWDIKHGGFLYLPENATVQY